MERCFVDGVHEEVVVVDHDDDEVEVSPR